jgi:alanine dehydrogenase
MVRRMRPSSVLVDISIDQGGCFEISRPTTHDAPTYADDIDDCVTNMPSAAPRTSTFALNNATLPFVLASRQRLEASASGRPAPPEWTQYQLRPSEQQAVASALNAVAIPLEEALMS